MSRNCSAIVTKIAGIMWNYLWEIIESLVIPTNDCGDWFLVKSYYGVTYYEFLDV